MNTQVKTKKRVEDHGEVFTHDREVNAMLDLVKTETLRIDSRFLEPACGNGNFLAEVLNRKLMVVIEKYGRSQLEFERYSIIAISSIYGVDILEDNVLECRERLINLFSEHYRRKFKKTAKPEYLKSAAFIISKNILWGDALTLTMSGDNNKPIIFSEWSAVNGSQIKRRDYALAKLLAYQPMEGENLFSDLGDQAFIPKPIKEFPLTHFLKVADHV